MTDSNLSNSPRTQAENTRENTRRVRPPVDIFENADGFLILADLPGVEPDGLKVEFNPPELHVEARPTANGTALLYERTFELGSGIDPGSISAELKHGVLRMELKKSPALRPRRINVKAA